MADIERIRCGSGNCFLIHQNGSAILVDTSRKPYRDKVFAACRNRNVRLIVLTHGHYDHVENAAWLSERLNAPIAMHRADSALICDNDAQPLLAGHLAGRMLLRAVSLGRPAPISPFQPMIYLKEGDSLAAFGVDANIVELPGHTKGSIGIRLGDQDLIVGDALMNLLVPCRSMLYQDAAAVTMSAHKISQSGVRKIHFGHGASVRNRMW